MRVARKVVLDGQQLEMLQQRARARSLPARVVERARIILRAADGLQDKEIAAQLGIRRRRRRAGAVDSWSRV
jgi:DNA-binding NarL/FixJ family response regulator